MAIVSCPHRSYTDLTMRFDFTVYDDSGRTRAIVEAKRSLGTDAVWAAQLRRNWLAHGPLPPSDAFILVLPDRLYMWNGSAPDDALPDVDIDAGPLLTPYFQRINTTPERIDPQVFEMLVAWWLEDIASPMGSSEHRERVPPWLLDAVTGGRIVSSAAA
jgi:hypothetical protein